MAEVTEVVKLRRRVLTEISRMAFEKTLAEKAADILTTLATEDGPRYRCCVYKERAVLKDYIKMALSQPLTISVPEAVENALAGKRVTKPVLEVMPVACDRCPIDKFLVTNACRNCIAHRCLNGCPRKAILIVQNQAHIDKTKCVECGLCKKNCPYGAIVEISRPCERACAAKAISADAQRRSVIDYDRCVQCGACKVACPFGAISDRSQIVQVIRHLQDTRQEVIALLAPAYIGQFGPKVSPGQVSCALKKMGFTQVREVSFGADVVTLTEIEEFLSTVPQKRPFMTTSCCPAFVSLVQKNVTEASSAVSSTVSPMIAAGRIVKREHPQSITVFIGPCIAKKAEALKPEYDGTIDYVLTFEELGAMFVGANINVAEIEAERHESPASRDGNTFARAGGLIQAVCDAAKAAGADEKVVGVRADGLDNCVATLQKMLAGQLSANFMEGMSCTGGCVGGPGTLTDPRVSAKLVDLYAAQSKKVTACENQSARDIQEKVRCFHVHEEDFSGPKRTL